MFKDKLIKKFGLLMVIPYLLIAATIYALFYKILTNINHQSFQGLEPSSHLVDFLYYSITTISTTGYGDIHPLSKAAKVVSGTEIVFGMTIVVHTIISYVRVKVSDKKAGNC